MNITKQCNNYIAESIILVILVNLCCYFAMQLGGYDLLAAQAAILPCSLEDMICWLLR